MQVNIILRSSALIIESSAADLLHRMKMRLSSLPLIFISFLAFRQHVGLAVAITPSSACSSTPHAALCLSVLTQNPLLPTTHFHYARHAVAYSLQQARDSSSKLNELLALHRPESKTARHGSLGACAELAESNTEFLDDVLYAFQEVEEAAAVADHVMMLMSAVLSDMETCIHELEGETWEGSAWLREHVHNESLVHENTLGLLAVAFRCKKRSPSNRLDYAKWAANGDGHDFIKKLSESVPTNQTLVVSKDETAGDFISINAAIDYVKNHSTDGKFVIFVREGTYDEIIEIPNGVTNLVGDGINRTVVTGNLSYVENIRSTFFTATFAVNGYGFTAMKMTFENTAGPEKQQAVAVRNSADDTVFYNCSFLGYQDTLYTHRHRQFYRECDVYGTVDFIFGAAAAVLQNCNIYVRRPLPGQKNTVTAQGRNLLNYMSGTSIQNCTVRAAAELEPVVGEIETYLGRPWSNYATTVFMESFIGGLIHPAGWLPWNDSGFGLDTLYYGEFDNYGPGSDTSGRVRWKGVHPSMNVSEALKYTVAGLIDGPRWIDPSIPCFPGLIN